MLRKIRLTLAVLSLMAITGLFLDFTGTLHGYLGWLAKIQFLPALLALNVGVIILLVALTLLVGRVYCSVICPLGILQDVIAWISGQRKKMKYRFSYSPELKVLRYGVLGVFIAAFLAGAGSLVALLAPYSAYGRIASHLFAPLYRWGNNGLAYLAERADSYAFSGVEVWLKSLPTLLIAVVTLIFLAVLAWRNGRTYCNTICPVGTILSLFARFSLFRPVLDGEKCKQCSLCSRRCKAACIDYKNQRIDYSRCVACMDCLEVCKHDALHLEWRFKRRSTPVKSLAETQAPAASGELNRRGFLSIASTLAAASALKAQEKKVDGGLAVIVDKVKPERATPIVPPGAWSARHFAQHCTGCQLCVASCPNEVLRASSEPGKWMQPELSYERGYCRPECNRCSTVCPAGAIQPISLAEKSATRIGHAVWVQTNCVPLIDGVECGNCARHCPSGAIRMVPKDADDPASVKIPVINEARCIGCGACENLCPARPFSAIYVEGHTMHSSF